MRCQGSVRGQGMFYGERSSHKNCTPHPMPGPGSHWLLLLKLYAILSSRNALHQLRTFYLKTTTHRLDKHGNLLAQLRTAEAGLARLHFSDLLSSLLSPSVFLSGLHTLTPWSWKKSVAPSWKFPGERGVGPLPQKP